MGYVSNPGGAGGGLPLLDPDAFVWDDPLSDWPDSLAVMSSNDPNAAGTFAENWGEKVIIVTQRAGDNGNQYIYALESSSAPYLRQWDSGTLEWGQEYGLVWDFQLSAATENISQLISSGDDVFTEAALLTDYLLGYTLFSAGAGANFGPNSGQAGIVETIRTGTTGKQVFTQTSNGNIYRRVYTGGAWGSWGQVTIS